MALHIAIVQSLVTPERLRADVLEESGCRTRHPGAAIPQKSDLGIVVRCVWGVTL